MRVIKDAPEAFVIMAIVVSAIVYFAAEQFHGERFATLHDHIQYLENKVKDYAEGKEKLSGATSDQAVKDLDALKGKITELQAQLNILTHPHQRHLSNQEADNLVTNLKKIQSEVPTIPVAFSSENETAVFADDFLGALDKSDIKYISLPSYVEPDECGVMVGTKDPSNPSAQTIKIRDALRSSGLSPRLVRFQPRFAFAYDFDLFIGPPCKG
jgi:hypothetical protein